MCDRISVNEMGTSVSEAVQLAFYLLDPSSPKTTATTTTKNNNNNNNKQFQTKLTPSVLK